MRANTDLLTRDLNDLRQQYFKLLLGVSTTLLWLSSMRFFSHDTRWERTWPIVAAILAAVLVGGLLSRRYFTWATTATTLCLATGVLLEGRLVGGSLSPALLPALVVLVSAISSKIAVLTGGYLVAGLLLLGRVGGTADSALGASLSTLVMVTLASLASSWQFRTAFAWARSAADRAERAAADAHERRLEAIRAVTAMKNAYYLLERTNHALARAQAELVEARRLKTEFVNMVSHELRAPLNYIVGFSELMVNSPEVYSTRPWPPRVLQDLTEIYRSSNHLSKLIDDILDLAQIEAHRLILKRDYGDMATVACEAADIVRPWQERKGLTLEEHYEEGLPALYLDRTRIRQVVLNLLNNAVRFTDRGKVILRVYRGRDEVVLSVADTGPGIPEDKLTSIFEEFVRLETPTGRPVEGTGLGLAISRLLIEMHGGRIWVTSDLGRGSTFFVALPVAGCKDSAALGSTPPSSYWETLQRQGLSQDILLFLGAEEGRVAMATEFPEYDVVRCSKDEVAAAVRMMRPRAVVVDQRDNDPEAVRSALDVDADDVPVISLSFRAREEDPLEGTQAHLTKPVTRQRLLQTLERVCPSAEAVLVVDDDPRMQRYIATTLEASGRGYRVYTVGSAEEALARLRLGDVHVTLLDLSLPDMNGTQLIRRIRQDETIGQLPIVPVTGVTNSGDEDTCGRDSFAVSCRRRLSRQQVVQLLKMSLDEIPPRRYWGECEPEQTAAAAE